MNDNYHHIKVIVMATSALTERWANYFCTETLNKEFDFEYWDCSQIAYPNFTTSQSLVRPYVVTMSSRDMLKQYLRELPEDTLILSSVFFSKANMSFHHLVGKYVSNCIYLSIWRNSLGMFSLSQCEEKTNTQIVLPWYIRIKHWIYQCENLRIIIKFFRLRGDQRFKREYQIYKQRREMHALKYIENYCRKQYKYVFELSAKKGDSYAINYPDVDVYTKLMDMPPIREGRYVVYLDQYFPLHPDMEESEPDINHKSMAEPFYKSINQFFGDIEQQLDCKVIIAAHPTANYLENPFDGREIVFYKTAELVKDCVGVCMHYSSAANFVALYDKPFVLIESEVTKQSPAFTKSLNHFAGIVHAPIINIDKNHENVQNLFGYLDKERKNAFLDTFCDLNNLKLNEELIPMHLKAIYNTLNSIK